MERYNEFGIINIDWVVFSDIFSDDCSIKTSYHVLERYLKNFYKRKEIDGKMIRFTLHDLDIKNVQMFINDGNKKSLFPISRQAAIHKLKQINKHLISNNVGWELRDIELDEDPSLYEEAIGFKIYDNTKWKITRTIERLWDWVYNHRIYCSIERKFNRISGRRGKDRKGW